MMFQADTQTDIKPEHAHDCRAHAGLASRNGTSKVANRGLKRLIPFTMLLAGLANPANAASKAEVSPSSLELANLMKSVPQVWFEDQVRQGAENMARSFHQTTSASRGRGCNPEIAECKSAAYDIAEKTVRAQIQEHWNRRVKLFALLIEANLKPAEIRGAASYFQTPGGAALSRALFAFENQQSWSPDIRAKAVALFEQPNAQTEQTPFDQFLDRTKALPRQAIPVVPPPPPAAPPVSRGNK